MIENEMTYHEIWSPHLKNDLVRLESVQHQSTRYILSYRDLDYVTRLRELNLLPLSFVREITDLVLLLNIIHNRMDVNIERFFLTDQGCRRGRSTSKFMVLTNHLCKTEKYMNFYLNRVSRSWNNMPDNIRAIQPPISIKGKPQGFKVALKKFYMGKLDSYNVNNTCTWTSICNCINT